MAVEISMWERCCLCVPLLPGLYAWGYFKIVVHFFLILMVGWLFLLAYAALCFGIPNEDFLIFLLFLLWTTSIFILLITDLVVTIVFICKGHEDNVRLIRQYYKYNIGVWVVKILLIVAAIGLGIAEWGEVTMRACVFYVVVVVEQTYLNLLLRSLVARLESSSECRQIRE